MKKIEVKALNPEAIQEAEKLMVCSARLTQRGEQIKSLNDFLKLYNKAYSPQTVKMLGKLPHNTIKQFAMITIAVIGASRRFLAQITRRRVGVTFMSASLQYSDYSGEANFVVPIEIEKQGIDTINLYLNSCNDSMQIYEALIKEGSGNDAAGYAAPQGLRNVLLISATPQAWLEMIQQRTCRRNTSETQYVMLLCWRELLKHSVLFENAFPSCKDDLCSENHMTCRNPVTYNSPEEWLNIEYGLYKEREKNDI